MPDVNFQCTQCGQDLVIDASAAGSGVRCPKCDTALTVPAASATPQSEAGAPPAPVATKQIKTVVSPRFILVTVALLLSIVLAGWYLSRAHKQSLLAADANKASVEVTALQQEFKSLEQGARKLVAKVAAQADAKEVEAKTLQGQRRYTDSIRLFHESGRLYQLALKGRVIRERQRDLARLKLLAESTVSPEQVHQAERLHIQAEGFVEAGDIDPSLSQFDEARKAYEDILSLQESVTSDQAAAARTAMLTVKEQMKQYAAGTTNLTAKAVKSGSILDMAARGQAAETAAAEALDDSEYGQSRALYTLAEKLYRESVGLHERMEKLLSARRDAEKVIKQLEEVIREPSRVVSFQLGKQALADADEALASEDLEAAQKHLKVAHHQSGLALVEAKQLNALAEARQAWVEALVPTDESLLTKYAPDQLQAAKTKAAEAQAKASDGDTEAAITLFKESLTTLRNAIVEAIAAAKAKEHTAKVDQLVARLDEAIAKKDGSADNLLAELEKLIPNDQRIARFRYEIDDKNKGVRAEQAVPSIKNWAFRTGIHLTLTATQVGQDAEKAFDGLTTLCTKLRLDPKILTDYIPRGKLTLEGFNSVSSGFSLIILKVNGSEVFHSLNFGQALMLTAVQFGNIARDGPELGKSTVLSNWQFAKSAAERAGYPRSILDRVETLDKLISSQWKGNIAKEYVRQVNEILKQMDEAYPVDKPLNVPATDGEPPRFVQEASIHINIDPELNTVLQLWGGSGDQSGGGAKRYLVDLKNKSRSTVRFDYRTEWTDAKGVKLQGPHEEARRAEVRPNRIISLQIVAPSSEAFNAEVVITQAKD